MVGYKEVEADRIKFEETRYPPRSGMDRVIFFTALKRRTRETWKNTLPCT